MGISRQNKLAFMDRNILDANCAPSIGPDVNHPKFIFFSQFFPKVWSTLLLIPGLYDSKILAMKTDWLNQTFVWKLVLLLLYKFLNIIVGFGYQVSTYCWSLNRKSKSLVNAKIGHYLLKAIQIGKMSVKFVLQI